jgi:glycosyltransferase involved in cell wall biosynthesis
MSRICLYYRQEPLRDRWLRGDRYARPAIRRIVRGRPRMFGMDKVFANLCLGLDRLNIRYEVNLPFARLRQDDRVGVLGRGPYVLAGYDRPNPILAGIGLMTHPSEWPTLCDDYPVAAYLQHSEWTKAIYEPYFGNRCRIWPVGIDTRSWSPSPAVVKEVDCLIYDKIHWQRETLVPQLLGPIHRELKRRGLSHRELRYGQYDETTYKAALEGASCMIFLCEHESQGIAYQECLASGVPILAWDQGRCLDPDRFAWGQPEIAATSVPYFDRRCGLTFRDAADFPGKLGEFLDRAQARAFAPREYVLENLTLEKCSSRFVELLDEASSRSTHSLGAVETVGE